MLLALRELLSAAELPLELGVGCTAPAVEVVSAEVDVELSSCEDLLFVQLNNNPIVNVKNNFFIILFFWLIQIYKQHNSWFMIRVIIT